MISVIIPYTKGDEQREKNLLQLVTNIKKQTYKDFELILVEMLFEKPNDLDIDDCNHICIAYPKNNRFNKSWAINVGVRNANSDNLLVVDADMVFGNDYFQKVVEFIEKSSKFFIGYSKLHCEIGKDNPEERIHNPSYLKAAGGAWYADKGFFWSVGGMNESYFGYCAEDNDLWQRVNHILGSIDELPYEMTHAYHDWHPKDSHFPLNDDRLEIFNQVMHDLDRATRKLKELKLGGKEPQKVVF